MDNPLLQWRVRETNVTSSEAENEAGLWLIQVPLQEVKAMPQKMGLSIVLPFKQTKGHHCTEPQLCCWNLRLLPTLKLWSRVVGKTAFPLIKHLYILHYHHAPYWAETQFCLTLEEKCCTVFNLKPFFYLHLHRLFPNRVLLRVAGAPLHC